MKRIIRKIYRILKSLLSPIIKVEVKQINYGEILKGKKILITGGTSGIGKALAIKCLNEGAIVTITGRNLEKLKEVAKEINNSNLRVIEWDITNIDIMDKKLEEVINLMGKIEIFFNNAGVFLGKYNLEVKEDEYDKILDTNLKGSYFALQKIAKLLIDNSVKGKIINIVSIAGYQGAYEPYGLSKWGGIGLTKGMAKYLIKKGIIVNGIAPGTIATPMTKLDSEENIYFERSLDERAGVSEEIAEIGVFLASDTTNHIVGQVITCDGGETLI